MLALQFPECHCLLHHWVLDKALTLGVEAARVHCLQLSTFIDDVADRSLNHALGEVELICRPGSQTLLAHAAIGILVFANLQALSIGKASLGHLCVAKSGSQSQQKICHTLFFTKNTNPSKRLG